MRYKKESFGESSFKESSFVSVNERAGRMSSGNQYRDANAWIEALDLILSYSAEYVLPGHTKPLIGRENVEEVLTNFRDAIEYVLNETLQGMNNGLTADELAASIKLPKKFAKLLYLGEFYGGVAWSVRSIFNGYV